MLTHPMVIGELACGMIHLRGEFLSYLAALPSIAPLENARVLQDIEKNRMMGRGIGFVDAHLLSSVIARGGTTLWTRDQRLKRIAEEMGIAFLEEAP